MEDGLWEMFIRRTAHMADLSEKSPSVHRDTDETSQMDRPCARYAG